MLSAMSGSTTRAGGLKTPERGERQRHAVGERERRDDQREAADRAAEQQQPDQEQEMVGPDQDVMDAGGDEASCHRERAAGAIPEKYSIDGPRGVEDDLLPQRAVLVDVDERLVLRVVGKEPRVQAQCRGPVAGECERQSQRLLLRQHLERPPGDRQRTITVRERQPRRQHPLERRGTRGGDGRVEQLRGRIDAEIVPRVEDVHRERAVAADAPRRMSR